MTVCPKCNGLGSISEGGVFKNAGERPPDAITCNECKGGGFVLPRFFVEFTFTSELSGKTYWLPLFILSNNIDKTNTIVISTKKALSEHFINITHKRPIPEAEFSKQYIQEKHWLHKNQKLAILSVDIWEFTDIEPLPEWSFEEHINYIVDNLPLEERTIAQRVEKHKFPVRVIREQGFPLEFNEFLLINLVK